VPPLAWDDEDIDDPAAEPYRAGRDPQTQRQGAYALTIAERQDLVRTLHRQQCSDREIARRTGMSDRTVLRIRARLGLPAVAA
jgi:DNA-binding CsgD family transcriptional regulator